MSDVYVVMADREVPRLTAGRRPFHTVSSPPGRHGYARFDEPSFRLVDPVGDEHRVTALGRRILTEVAADAGPFLFSFARLDHREGEADFAAIMTRGAVVPVTVDALHMVELRVVYQCRRPSGTGD